MTRSAATTVTDAVALLLAEFGSVPFSLTVTVSEMVVPATPDPGITVTITVSVAFPAGAITVPELAVHVIVPVPPTGGNVPHVHPAGAAALVNVVFAGVVSLSKAPT
ncbi:MAG TPA: hypothetical protein VJS43_13495, partial [Candidatus Acidoferrales bacterium]|nr:hypothetical protein [Candidatus Acidoferrales bacterium]